MWHFPEELCREQQPRKGFQCLAGEDEESVSTEPPNRNSGLSQNHSLGARVEFCILISLWGGVGSLFKTLSSEILGLMSPTKGIQQKLAPILPQILSFEEELHPPSELPRDPVGDASPGAKEIISPIAPSELAPVAFARISSWKHQTLEIIWDICLLDTTIRGAPILRILFSEYFCKGLICFGSIKPHI